jgi:carboxypeptidase C (cathepsin A)
MGQALNIIEFSQRPANIISYVVSLPTLTAIAWSHGKADLGAKTFEQHHAECWQFSRTEYLNALFEGKTIDPARKQAIAARLEAYTAIPAAYYMAHDLRISKETYRRELFRDQHLILGMDDARYKGPAAQPGEPAFNPSHVLYESLLQHFIAYMRTDLRIAGVEQYAAAATDITTWDYGGAGPFSDWPFPSLLTEVFVGNPNFRVAVGNGYQDTQTTVGAAQYLVDQAPWPADRTSIHFYQGGHMAYTIEASLRQMMSDVRALLTAHV